MLSNVHFAENYRWYLMFFLILTGVLILLLLPIYRWYDNDSVKQLMSVVFNGSLYAGGAVLASFQFRPLRRKQELIQTLLLPVRASERIVSAILISFLIYIVLFFIAYMLANLISGIGAAAFMIKSNMGMKPSWLILHQFLPEVLSGKMILYNNISLLSVQAFFLFGAVRFRENSFGYSLLILFSYLIVLGVTNALLGAYYLTDIMHEQTLKLNAVNLSIEMLTDFNSQIYQFSNSFMNVKLITIIGTALWWMASYHTLKEKEVRNG